MARHYKYHLEGVRAEHLTEVPCAVCGGNQARELGLDNGFPIKKCVDPRCGFVYVSPRPVESQLAKLYEAYYADDEVVPQRWEAEMRGIFRECADWIRASGPPGRVLDVGCSFGHFLQRMESYGWQTVGIDHSPVAAAASRERIQGVVYESGLEAVDLEPGSFDAATVLYVLEHVYDARRFLQKIHSALRPGGLAIVRIPYNEPLFPLSRMLRRPLLYAPMHLNDFSPTALRRLATSVGFERVEVLVGARRHASDLVENAGATLLGGVGRLLEFTTRGRVVFPWVGALSYRLYA